MRSLAIGLDAIVKLVREDDAMSMYDLNGFNRCDFEVRRYVGIASFSVRPAESLQLELLEDDRLLTRFDDIWRAFEEEVEYVVGLPSSVWKHVASILGYDIDWQDLLSWAVESLHVSVADIDKGVFAQVRRLPLSLTQGDTAASLQALE